MMDGQDRGQLRGSSRRLNGHDASWYATSQLKASIIVIGRGYATLLVLNAQMDGHP